MVGVVCLIALACYWTAPDLTGRLDPVLHSHQHWVLELHGGGSIPLMPTGEQWVGSINIPPLVFLHEGGQAAVVLVETDQGQHLFVDLNRDGALSRDEEPPRLPHALGAGWVIRFRFTGERPGEWPLLATLKERAKGGSPTLVLDSSPYLTGQVNVSSRKILLRIPFDLSTMNAQPRLGYLGIDSDADGSITDDTFSAEATYAMDEDVVLRVLDRYVSIVHADVNTGTFRLAEHPANHYEKMEMTLGALVPDFSFHTSAGHQQRLSDFTGKYVLLFVWNSGCYFAGEEIASVRQAFETFRTRGFVVLGLSDDEDVDKAKAFVLERRMTWPQVLGPEGVAFVHRRIRAVGLPTLVLLDGERRVVSRNDEGEPPIRGEALLVTLERLIPR